MKRYVSDDVDDKISMLKENGSIADPWYTGDFEKTYENVKMGVEALINRIRRERNV